MTDIGTQVSTSLDTLTREFDIVAHNLANASTAGYKRRCNAFTRALDEQTGTGGDGSGQEESAMPLDFSQGSLVQTDRTLDFALYGQGFFVIETPEGPLYTRHGVFQTNPNGQIVDLSGRVVAGVAGPISLPCRRRSVRHQCRRRRPHQRTRCGDRPVPSCRVSRLRRSAYPRRQHLFSSPAGSAARRGAEPGGQAGLPGGVQRQDRR